jgi:hypothetical protein
MICTKNYVFAFWFIYPGINGFLVSQPSRQKNFWQNLYSTSHISAERFYVLKFEV